VAMGQGFFQVLQFSFVSIIPLWLSIRIHNLGGMNNRPVGGRSLET
jgi:hypothetical protein